MALYLFSHFSLCYEYTSTEYDKQYIKLKLGINYVGTVVTPSHDVIRFETWTNLSYNIGNGLLPLCYC